jgi:recombination protein RecT
MAQSNLRNQARGQVATRDPSELKTMVGKMEAQFQLAMPKGMEAKQLIRDFMTVLQVTPSLATCEPRSILGALMTCSQLGLRPGVLGQAWVVPFKGKGQLIIGYKGLATLAQRTSAIASITTRIIHENDYYDYEFGLEERLIHKPAMTGPRGEPVAYYSVVRTNTGGKYWEVMSRIEMEEHRDLFAMGRAKGTIGKAGPHLKGVVVGPWVDNFDAMAKKTVVIKALNLAPASTELQRAFDVDGSTRFDISPTANVSEVSIIEDNGEDAIDGEIDPDDPGFENVPPHPATRSTPTHRDPAEPTAEEWARMQEEGH